MKKSAVAVALCCVVAAVSGCETINAQLAAAEASLKEQSGGSGDAASAATPGRTRAPSPSKTPAA
jgi:hypothetical protein